MGLFVRIEQATLAEGNAPKLLLLGELIAIKAACVTDVILADVPRAREFARIIDYPQWTESQLALFLRLLRRAGPIPELADEAVGRATVALTDNAAGDVSVEFADEGFFAMKGVRESLLVEIHASILDCSLISSEALALTAGTCVHVLDDAWVDLMGVRFYGATAYQPSLHAAWPRCPLTTDEDANAFAMDIAGLQQRMMQLCYLQNKATTAKAFELSQLLRLAYHQSNPLMPAYKPQVEKLMMAAKAAVQAYAPSCGAGQQDAAPASAPASAQPALEQEPAFSGPMVLVTYEPPGLPGSTRVSARRGTCKDGQGRWRWSAGHVVRAAPFTKSRSAAYGVLFGVLEQSSSA
jgi:hypothetical protein